MELDNHAEWLKWSVKWTKSVNEFRQLFDLSAEAVGCFLNGRCHLDDTKIIVLCNKFVFCKQGIKYPNQESNPE